MTEYSRPIHYNYEKKIEALRSKKHFQAQGDMVRGPYVTVQRVPHHGNNYHYYTIERRYRMAANGFHGMVDHPTHFLAGEAGPERVNITPIKKHKQHHNGFDLGFEPFGYYTSGAKEKRSKPGQIDFDFGLGF